MPTLIHPLSTVRLVVFLLICACHQANTTPENVNHALSTGHWRMELDLDSTDHHLGLPFLFDVDHRNSGWCFTIHNQNESIVVDSVNVQGDSIRVYMPFFDSEFRGIIQDTGHFHGTWHNHYKGPDYAIPFTATWGPEPRFITPPESAATDIAGDWEVHFIEQDGSEPAIGIFTADEGKVRGSFATETGDLRFLDGITTRDSLFLSSFNGSQAFLFRAAIRNDSLVGEFRSGHRWKQPWYGIRNPTFKLANDETITTLVPGQLIAFKFPDTDGNLRTLADEQYRGKAVVIEIMGTWCPNCMDQSRMLDELYGKFHKEGMEAIALSFERYPNQDRALAAIRHFKKRLGVRYEMLYGGMANRDSVAHRLPFISKLMSYPTTLLIGRDGTVRHIYTGIYGPSTGTRYLRFRERMENAIAELLREPPANAE